MSATSLRVTVIGATGMLGRPVARGLVREGFDVTVVSRDPATLAELEGTTKLKADLFDQESLRAAFDGRDTVYLNLRSASNPSQPQPETDGLRNVIAAAQTTGVKRIAMISSLVQNYQGRNGFNWWAFDRKLESVRILKGSGIGWTVFYPSSFMENFVYSYRQGDKIMLVGTSKHPQWFIAGDDYASQVARALETDSASNREYVVQGPEPFTTEQAAHVFVEHHTAERLRISRSPLWPLKLAGFFNRGMSDLWHIIEALNEYPERFEADTTWRELGKPQTTLARFAERASQGL